MKASYDAKIGRESDRAFEYFLLYRDMPPQSRSIRKLMQYEVNGEKAQFTPLGRWSSQYAWQERVRDFDFHGAQLRMMKLREQHQAENQECTENMYQTTRAFHNAINKKLDHLAGQPAAEMAANELRQLALTFDITSKWLCQLIGIQESNNN